jgi:hypothetical protein
VWWLNAFGSEAEKQQVTEDYAKNPALVAALADITRRREGLTGSPVDTFASYRVDLSRGAPPRARSPTRWRRRPVPTPGSSP